MTTVRGWDGRVIVELERADASGLAEAGWRPPEPFRVTAADGKTDIYGVIHMPPDFDPSQRSHDNQYYMQGVGEMYDGPPAEADYTASSPPPTTCSSATNTTCSATCGTSWSATTCAPNPPEGYRVQPTPLDMDLISGFFS